MTSFLLTHSARHDTISNTDWVSNRWGNWGSLNWRTVRCEFKTHTLHYHRRLPINCYILRLPVQTMSSVWYYRTSCVGKGTKNCHYSKQNKKYIPRNDQSILRGFIHSLSFKSNFFLRNIKGGDHFVRHFLPVNHSNYTACVDYSNTTCMTITLG